MILILCIFITFNIPQITKLLQELNNIISKPEIGVKTIFIVPSFEVLFDNLDEYQALNKKELINYVRIGEISPFHEKQSSQQCTQYSKGINISSDDAIYYKLDY